MKNKLTTLLVIFVMLFTLTACNKKEEKTNTECMEFTGGGYYVLFNTNGAEEFEPMYVCIACAPDTYEELPIPTLEGKTFEGWYYDEELTDFVGDITTMEIVPVEKFDNNNCKIGYEDIKLHAKWN